MKEKDCSVWPLVGSVEVFRMWSETEMMAAQIEDEDLTGPLR